MDKQKMLEDFRKNKKAFTVQKDADALAIDLAEKAVEHGYECVVGLFDSDAKYFAKMYAMNTGALLIHAAEVLKVVLEESGEDSEKIMTQFTDTVRKFVIGEIGVVTEPAKGEENG